MLELLALLGSLAAFPAGFGLMLWFGRTSPSPPAGNEPFYVGPSEPCWTEEIISDGRYSYGRCQCVNEVLIELDARARRGDPPFVPAG